VVLPFWKDLFSETGYELNTWFFNFSIVMLCLVNMVDWFSVDKKVFRISAISLFVVLVSMIIEFFSSPGILASISITMKSLSFIVMTFYFFNMLYVRTKSEMAITYRSN
jgi:hypothetical protein